MKCTYLIEIKKGQVEAVGAEVAVPTQKTTRLPDINPKHNYQSVKQIAKSS